jgi:regulator of sirC expression with transglutaminase-like and TPR domain
MPGRRSRSLRCVDGRRLSNQCVPRVFSLYNTTMNLNTALTLLAQNSSAPLDLAEVALLLARDEYMSLDVEGYLSELTAMAQELRPRLRGSLEGRIKVLCRYLFHDMGFRGNQRDYYDARNSYLNEVLDRRTGIPITLSAVAMAVGSRAGLEVVGVGLPGHFVVRAEDEGREILFDPFHGGKRLTPEECAERVRSTTGMSFEATPDALRPVPLGAMVMRMLTNLKGIYLGQGDFTRAARVIGRLRQLSPEDVVQGRDLGVSLLQMGQPGKAIDPLAAYLAALPSAPDVEAVRRLLDRARASVARWN